MEKPLISSMKSALTAGLLAFAGCATDIPDDVRMPQAGDLASAPDRGSHAADLETGTVLDDMNSGRGDLSDEYRAADCGARPDQGGVPDFLADIFHLSSVADEVNLRLGGAMTFDWAVNGCDYCSGGSGTWTASGGNVQLAPLPGRPTFAWFTRDSFVFPADAVLLSWNVGDQSRLSADVSGRGMRFSQEWRRGRICILCGNAPGSKALAACCKPESGCSLP